MRNRSGAAGLVALAAVALMGADSGGYFPPSWGVYTALLTWTAIVGLIVRRQIAPGAAEARFLVALAVLGAWNLLSVVWAAAPQAPLLDSQRTLLYITFVAALIVWSDRRSAPLLLVGAAIGGFGVSAYALLSRLLPDLFGLHDDPVAKGRLYQPLGYWNALGIFATMTALLALGAVMRARTLWARAVAAAVVPPLATTVYFTYSRGSILAGVVAVAVALALDERRLRSLTMALVTAPWAAAAVAAAATSGALDRSGAGVSRVTAAGRPLLVIVIVCGAAAAGSILGVAAAERRVVVTRGVRTGYVAGLGLAFLVVLGLSFARFGGPQTIVVHAVEDLGSRPIVSKGSQNARLLSLSLNGRPALWRAALSDFEAHPVAGSGAGTFEQYWLQHRPRIYVSRYAHSIYLESLAEGGAIRLLMLAVVLGIPLVAAVRLRRDPLVLTALAALLAYMLHAGSDWDWEMPAVTALALACAVAILVRARDDSPLRVTVPFGRAVAAGACAVAFAVGAACWYGNDALARSASAQGRGDWVAAERNARTAAAWMPWSDSPDLVLAAALVHRGDARDARGVLRQATRRNPVDWAAWQQLADVTKGGEHARALARAEALNPKGMRRVLHQRRRRALGLAGHG